MNDDGTEELLPILEDPAAKVNRMFADEVAEIAVGNMASVEQQRRMWCVQVVLQAYNLESTQENFLNMADKVYDYVYGVRVK